MIFPVTAAAAAVSGDARNVRPPFPCRPSKFRLLVLTAYSPGRKLITVHGNAHRAARLAPFGAGVFEHLVESFRLRLAFDVLRTGDDKDADLGSDFAVFAVPMPPERKSVILEFVQLPINTTFTGRPSNGCPGCMSIYASAFSSADRCEASPT